MKIVVEFDTEEAHNVLKKISEVFKSAFDILDVAQKESEKKEGENND